MEEKRVPDGWETVDRGKIVMGEDGRMKLLGTCKCGSPVWLKQGRLFKSLFYGQCPSCRSFVTARVKTVRITKEDVEKDEGRVRDIDVLVTHVCDKAVREMDPILYDAAMMLTELHEKHWNECLQIGKYSDAEEILMRCVLAERDEHVIHRTEDEVPPLGVYVLAWRESWDVACLTEIEAEDGTATVMWEVPTDALKTSGIFAKLDAYKYWAYLPDDPIYTYGDESDA